MAFHKMKTKPKLTRRYLNFQKTQPPPDYFSLIKTVRNPNDIISNTEVILSQRTYYPTPAYNNEIKPYPPIRKNQKLYKTHRVKNLTLEPNPSQIDDAPLYIENYLMNRNPQYKLGNTIYTVLTKRKNEYIDKLIQGNQTPFNQAELLQEAKKRNHCIKVNHPNTNYYDMRKIDAIPIVNHVPCNQEYAYRTISEKDRFQRATENLLKLKEWINNNPDLCNVFLKEYIWRNGIYDDEYYRISKLINLSNYLNSDFKVDPRKSMKEILIEGLNYLDSDYIEKKKRTESRADTQVVLAQRPIKKKALKEEANAMSNIMTDMNLQNNLHKHRSHKNEFDIINQPDEIVNMLKDDFTDEANSTEPNVCLPIPSPQLSLSMKKKIKAYSNKPKTTSSERLYKRKKDKCDYEFVKKSNKLLEYVCYMKAKNNLQYLKLKNQFLKKSGKALQTYNC